MVDTFTKYAVVLQIKQQQGSNIITSHEASNNQNGWKPRTRFTDDTAGLNTKLRIQYCEDEHII